jgi:hypothetical protein
MADFFENLCCTAFADIAFKKTILPPIVEEEEDEYVWDSSYGMAIITIHMTILK